MGQHQGFEATVEPAVEPALAPSVDAPADASVTVDDQYLGFFGYVAKHGVAMPAGKHRITVEKTGFFPWDKVVEAQGPPVELDVVLTRIPD